MPEVNFLSPKIGRVPFFSFYVKFYPPFLLPFTVFVWDECVTVQSVVFIRFDFKRNENIGLFFPGCTPSVNPIVSDCFLCVFGKTDRPATRWIQILALTIRTRVFNPFVRGLLLLQLLLTKKHAMCRQFLKTKTCCKVDYDAWMSPLQIQHIPANQSTQ